MPTVDVRITSMYPPGEVGSIRGYASATIDSCLAIRGIKVVEGGEPTAVNWRGWRKCPLSTAVYLREFGHHHFNISQTELKHPANKADVSYSHPMRKNTWRSFKCLRKILFP